MNINLHFDCLSGISGDMTLGALIDLGVDPDLIRTGLASLNVADLKLHVDDVKKCGFRATHIRVEHPEQKAHRHLHHIEAMIDAADAISDGAKTLARRIFQCIGEAEAKVHGCDLRKVHFHEVGAVDSIADIVGVAIAIDALGIDSVTSSAIPTGTGSITIDHGRVAVPAPATVEILTGVPLAYCEIESELTTPTGAAIIKTLASSFGPAPAMTPHRVGYGAGTRDLPGQANVLRVTMGQLPEAASDPGQIETDRVTLLETNIDDATAEQLADVTERLMRAGALDVWQTPCVMKKGRLASVVSVLCGGSKAATMQSILFQHTSTIGIRRQILERAKLARQAVEIETAYGPAQGKVVTLPDGEKRFSLEDDEAKRLSRSSGKSTAEMQREAVLAWSQQQPE
ncbi:nickel pincer cofactor biosynthesis protein LarC [Aporhodopirellula aestuarii]|uniref:Putative nickel insertion protein n=1 Tax=Aporhodopirellula aestuarii TaxID=2950107 RepID=A0ABT0U023_9BACT|nr:nickel pincer cofactor biosynthesis protein LarC [Aporhodopirellula aestuarii]MCM2370214.1 nickel pincer cofactor biosynthesis protein LarC [Aporhodopirellula aestuarii]